MIHMASTRARTIRDINVVWDSPVTVGVLVESPAEINVGQRLCLYKFAQNLIKTMFTPLPLAWPAKAQRASWRRSIRSIFDLIIMLFHSINREVSVELISRPDTLLPRRFKNQIAAVMLIIMTRRAITLKERVFP
jgi:hypothetical protein